MGLKDRLRRLEREAEEDGIVIRLQNGTVRVFDPTVVALAKFAARMNLMRGISQACEVLDAVRRATPESRAAFEESCGSIVMGINIIAAEDEGGWVETRTLTETGEIERVFYEGGSAEAAERPAGRYSKAASARHWFRQAEEAGPGAGCYPQGTAQEVGRIVDDVCREEARSLRSARDHRGAGTLDKRRAPQVRGRR